MATPWNDDPNGYEPQILANVTGVLHEIDAQAGQRADPTLAMAQDWHRRLYDQVPLPAVGGFLGVSSALVPQALTGFEGQVQQAVQQLGAQIAPGSLPADSNELGSVLVLCASLHGEWVRIHPFANGNGRTARMWANWAALRYGLPAFVSVKPRPPGNPYAAAGMSSMAGDHDPLVAVFYQMLAARLTGGSP